LIAYLWQVCGLWWEGVIQIQIGKLGQIGGVVQTQIGKLGQGLIKAKSRKLRYKFVD
jgi:hypothetical protein